MLGVVLAGGQSLRMGSDKGLLTYQGRLWAEIAAEKLGQLDIPVKISVNAGQYQSYADFFSTDQLIADHPSLSIKGPLLGLLSAHLAAPAEDLLVLACDMVLMETRLLSRLCKSVELNSNFDACIFNREGQQEPLCGIYRSGALQILAEEQLLKHSMKYVLSRMKVLEIPVSAADAAFFGNFNAPGDLLSD